MTVKEFEGFVVQKYKMPKAVAQNIINNLYLSNMDMIMLYQTR